MVLLLLLLLLLLLFGPAVWFPAPEMAVMDDPFDFEYSDVADAAAVSTPPVVLMLLLLLLLLLLVDVAAAVAKTTGETAIKTFRKSARRIISPSFVAIVYFSRRHAISNIKSLALRQAARFTTEV